MDDWSYRSAADHGMRMGESLKSVRRESGLVGYGLQRAFWAGIKGYLAAWHRISIRGREHLPERPPFVVVANHASHLDVLTLAASLPRRLRPFAFPIAAGDTFFHTPAHALFSSFMLNALPMWRHHAGRHAISDLRRRLEGDDCIYLLFPEGTRSRDGSLGRFKPGVGMLVAGTPVPVVPCHLRGAHRALPPGKAIPRPVGLELTIGEPRRFESVGNTRAGWQEVAATLREAVAALRAVRDTMAGDDVR